MSINKTSDHKYPYNWKLKETEFTKDKGKVFSCFSCGGGSTMGYKLAGFDVIGCNEIDPKMMEVYKHNHNPKYSYLEGIQTFKDRQDLPQELYNLDILDGSPPCSSFSMAGNREKDWGKEKKFREGQAEQVLDTLFFDFIDLAERLQPKVVIAENVKGILMGDAKKYCAAIYEAFDKAGYYLDKWLLDASKMGVPQRRERVFFIAIRKDLSELLPPGMDMFNNMPGLNLEFNEFGIAFGEFRTEHGLKTDTYREELMQYRIPSDKCLNDISLRKDNKMSGFTSMIYYDNQICPTVTSHGYDYRDYDGFKASELDYCIAQTFPEDYNFNGMGSQYVCGMSVPPVMTAQIADRIHEQWLSKIKELKKITTFV